jgi:hemoglobin-like flavoprotein
MGTGISVARGAAVHPLSPPSCCALPNPSPLISSAEMNDVVILLMPTYYTPSQVTHRDITLAQASWNLILSNKSIEFVSQNSSSPQFQELYQGKCLNWFTDLFYQRFFDIHPIAKTLFFTNNNSLIRKEKLTRQVSLIISLTLSQKKDGKKFLKLMRELAMSHCHRGVHPIEYGIMGNVLFHTLQKCLGNFQYGDVTDQAWKSIYSSMLRQIVPECVRFELEQREKDEYYQQYKLGEYEKRCRGMDDSFLERILHVGSHEFSARVTSSYLEHSLLPNRLICLSPPPRDFGDGVDEEFDEKRIIESVEEPTPQTREFQHFQDLPDDR